MIVIDASAMVEVLLVGPHASVVRDRIEAERGILSAPHLIDIEVAQVLRRFYHRGELTATRGQAALAQLAQFGIRRYPHTLLLATVWRLRDNITAFDGAYVALAEVLDAPLVTTDARLATAPGHAATIEVIGAG